MKPNPHAATIRTTNDAAALLDTLTPGQALTVKDDRAPAGTPAPLMIVRADNGHGLRFMVWRAGVMTRQHHEDAARIVYDYRAAYNAAERDRARKDAARLKREAEADEYAERYAAAVRDALRDVPGVNVDEVRVIRHEQHGREWGQGMRTARVDLPRGVRFSMDTGRGFRLPQDTAHHLTADTYRRAHNADPFSVQAAPILERFPYHMELGHMTPCVYLTADPATRTSARAPMGHGMTATATGHLLKLEKDAHGAVTTVTTRHEDGTRATFTADPKTGRLMWGRYELEQITR